MTIDQARIEDLTSASGTSLTGLRRQILEDAALSPTRRRDIASALSAMAKALGRPLDVIPANPAALRALLKGVTAARMGHRPGRWRNIRSLVGAALARSGQIQVPARSDLPPSPAWAALLGKSLPRDTVYRLGRFARYCTAEGVAPEAVDDAVLARFRAALDAGSVVADPARSQRETALQWNRAAAAYPDWPQRRLGVPDHRLYYTPDWTTYPPSLLRDVDAWLASLRDAPLDDLLSDTGRVRALRPATVQSRRTALRLYLGALVLSGEDSSTMLDLHAVVTSARVKVALEFFLRRGDGKPSHHTAQIARLALGIARHWVRLPDDDLGRLRVMTGRVTPAKWGMTIRNRARLRPFRDEAVNDRLLELPARLCREVEDEVRRSGKPNAALARQYQTAVLIEILQLVPLRMTNLAALRIGTHLLRTPEGKTFLVIEGDEMKNGQPLEGELPAEAVAMIDRYVKRYRPLLGDATGDWLFPGRGTGRHKSHDGIRDQITTTLAERCGVVMHPHLFRHLAALRILRDNPAAYGQVQRVLHHKHLSTTGFYTGLEAPEAIAHFQRTVLSRRGCGGTSERQRR